MKKIPLGKLSKSQIQLTYSVLNRKYLAVKTRPSSVTGQTLIPDDFGMQKPTLLGREDILIKSKTG